ncbi:hypothetical protein [Novosphingobium sp. KA1]|uniref:hypothetical protein n=1 Tax=Novosphingobium sp. (strain KA1) TaxID=164608 RepID=UPI001A8DECDD|nr:hypothetical protein [Novosphingobium sp. KA1]QSR18439.1 hypothetical protein CA833_14790 [Novosphingobium sp. KA1]
MSAPVNPRYAAFVSSFGRDPSLSGVQAWQREQGNVPFMTWIGKCRRTASAPAVVNGNVADHDAFTAHCWQVARDDAMARFAA